MALWSFAQVGLLAEASSLLALAEARGKLGVLGFGAIFSEYEKQDCLEGQVKLLWRAAAGDFGAAAVGVAAQRLAVAGDAGGALALQRAAAAACKEEEEASAEGLRLLFPMEGVVRACGGPCDEGPGLPLLAGVAPGRALVASGSKAVPLLQYVRRVARAGDPASVCGAVESFSEDVLQPARQWFKIVGGEKARVIVDALGTAPERGAFLEIGTYLGYSSLRVAISQPGRRIVSLEVDPRHALAAQCLISYAGRAHQIDVWTGHSQDLLGWLPSRYARKHAEEEDRTLALAGVFFDQCGSRFWTDLELLLKAGLLLPGTVFVADNVLKPGAPLLLWHLFHGAGRAAGFRATVASVEEFAMPGVEDWVAIAHYEPSGVGLPEAVEVPQMVWDLEWEARRVRDLAARRGSVSFDVWAAHSARMRKAMGELGIAPA